MATSSEILKEYLLSLGFKINTQQEKRWTSTMTGVTKGAKTAGIAVAGFAAAAVTAFELYADGMEKLYYASQRTRIPIKNLQALDYAGEQAGISAGTMNAALTKFASFMRNNPFMNQQLKILGVDPNQSPDRQFLGLLKALHGIENVYMRNAKASLFGIDPEELNTFMVAGPEKLEAIMNAQIEHMDRMGLKADEVGKAMVEWQNTLRDVGQEFKNLEGIIAVHLIGPMHVVSEMTKDWLRDLGSAIEKDNPKTWGEGSKSEAIGEALAGNTGANFAKIPASPNTGSGFFNDDATATLQNWRHWAVSLLYGEAEATRRLGFSRMYGGDGGGAGRGSVNPASVVPGSGGLPLGLRNHNPGNLRPAGATTGFQTFGSDEQGLAALARQLLTYGDRGKNTLRSIIGTYAPPGENNTGAYVSDLMGRLGIGPDEVIDLHNAAQLSRLMGAIVTHEGNAQGISQGALDSGALAGITMGGFTQHNTIVVQGGNPSQVERAVNSALDKSNGDLVRNVRTVFDTPRLAP